MDNTQGNREGQVRQQLISLEKVIESLNGEIVNLENRLQLVLREADAAEAESAKTPMETLVPLADEIRAHVRRVRTMTGHLVQLGKHLEL